MIAFPRTGSRESFVAKVTGGAWHNPCETEVNYKQE